VTPLRRDSGSGPDFPGRVLPKDRWTRTRVGLGARGAPFDWNANYGRAAPRVVDLGCGNGRFLIASALARRGVDHLGIELVPQAVRLASLRAGQRGLTNCKFAWGDASEFILERCAPGSLAEVHLYHPQPYYDANKRERRQLAPAVVGAIHRALEPGGLLVFQTDNPAYAAYARRVVPELFSWHELAGPWPNAPAGRTLREIVARGQGLEILRAEARRLELDDAERERRVAAMAPPEFDAKR
jgi:tRNA (guanine-N7-)-methyltransferase